jgi:hypothetical protein
MYLGRGSIEREFNLFCAKSMASVAARRCEGRGRADFNTLQNFKSADRQVLFYGFQMLVHKESH